VTGFNPDLSFRKPRSGDPKSIVPLGRWIPARAMLTHRLVGMTVVFAEKILP
jgi:hypothetical protein